MNAKDAIGEALIFRQLLAKVKDLQRRIGVTSLVQRMYVDILLERHERNMPLQAKFPMGKDGAAEAPTRCGAPRTTRWRSPSSTTSSVRRRQSTGTESTCQTRRTWTARGASRKGSRKDLFRGVSPASGGGYEDEDERGPREVRVGRRPKLLRMG